MRSPDRSMVSRWPIHRVRVTDRLGSADRSLRFWRPLGAVAASGPRLGPVAKIDSGRRSTWAREAAFAALVWPC
jgi:hypothetical protein